MCRHPPPHALLRCGGVRLQHGLLASVGSTETNESPAASRSSLPAERAHVAASEGLAARPARCTEHNAGRRSAAAAHFLCSVLPTLCFLFSCLFSLFGVSNFALVFTFSFKNFRPILSVKFDRSKAFSKLLVHVFWINSRSRFGHFKLNGEN